MVNDIANQKDVLYGGNLWRGLAELILKIHRGEPTPWFDILDHTHGVVYMVFGQCKFRKFPA